MLELSQIAGWKNVCYAEQELRFFYMSLWSVILLQWNFSNPDILGTEEGVLISEVS